MPAGRHDVHPMGLALGISPVLSARRFQPLAGEVAPEVRCDPDRCANGWTLGGERTVDGGESGAAGLDDDGLVGQRDHSPFDGARVEADGEDVVWQVIVEERGRCAARSWEGYRRQGRRGLREGLRGSWAFSSRWDAPPSAFTPPA